MDRPVLETVGKTVVHVCPPGAGQTVKAANQLIVAGTIQLVSEAIVLLEAHGVDMEPAIKVLAGGLAGCCSSSSCPDAAPADQTEEDIP